MHRGFFAEKENNLFFAGVSVLTEFFPLELNLLFFFEREMYHLYRQNKRRIKIETIKSYHEDRVNISAVPLQDREVFLVL